MGLDAFFPKFSLRMLAQQAQRAVFKQQQTRRAVFKAARGAMRRFSKQEPSLHQSRRKLGRRIKGGDDAAREDRTARRVFRVNKTRTR
jgi:hypothetical protein